MFEENKLPANYNPFDLRQQVESSISNFPEIEAVYDQEFIPMFMTSTNMEWFKERANSIDTSNDDNTVQISVKKDPVGAVKNNKNLIEIEFGKEDESDTIGITPLTDITAVIDSLKDKVKDKKSGIYLYIHGKDIDFTPTSKQVKNYIKQ